MSEPLRLSLREDGTFDPDCLELAGQRWVTAWLKARLSGQDPYFPIDKRGDEDPESLIVAILRDAGMAHPAYNLIAEGILDLLDEARKAAPETPSYLDPAVRICERVRLPLTSTWFTEELRSLAAGPEAIEERWSARQVKEILHGAILQSPGLPRAASHASWRAILKMPRYATLAWMGLAQSFAASVSYIEDWWKACPAPQRQAELDQFIFTGLKTEGEEGVLKRLISPLKSWSADLQAAIGSALEKHGVPTPIPTAFGASAKAGDLVAPAQDPPSGSAYLSEALVGAARHRERVLQEQRKAA